MCIRLVNILVDQSINQLLFFCSIGQVREERQHHETHIKLYDRMIKKAGGFPAGKGILKKKGPAGINLAGPFYCGGVKMFIVDTHTLCTYNIIMKFEWDEKKRQTNIIKHRIDFADAIELFKGPSLILEDNRQDYGEERYIAFGIINNRHIALSFTERSGRIRIISMRKANKREQEKYKEAIVDRLEKS